MARAICVKKGDKLIEKRVFREEGRRIFFVRKVKITKTRKIITAWTHAGEGVVEIEFTGAEVRRLFDLVKEESR